ncbi:substrate-binding domain-containing protein [Paracraurococcus lichenis]|uniref:Substrate-binding domain-containing protein n=1 Tax=Paracraurococcus lichenis TaxID=3064888 RepID=A0ABT9E8I8_9PROT|nr:substrate-binding domain-containing protein [Paracraurococcus sp. LOR1-02]MDO9712494.1 substrate-binding domain-containing protein [Paracraurococcus sp. LOR1-02]
MSRLAGVAAVIAFLATATAPALAQGPLRLFAAGSLREAMTEITVAYSRETGRQVTASFGFSGVMRERIERGEAADLFASADTGHPQRLLRDGRASRVVLFARNALCLVAPSGTGLSDRTAVQLLLNPSVPLGIFPPVQDPVGDYTLELFRRLEAEHPGAEAALHARTTVITEALLSRALSAGEDLAVALLQDGRMRLHVSYCSTARIRLAAAVPGLEIAALPAALAVGPAYGLAVLREGRAGVQDLALFILGEVGQRTLERFGFTPVTLP